MKKKNRPIRMGCPSGKLKLVLWEVTDDERAFEIKAQKTKPYVMAYGIKYELTPGEIEMMHKMQKLL